jgi:L-fuconolactonase
MKKAKVVDSHVHFWQLVRGYYTALEPDMTILLQDHLPQDLAPLLEAAGVDQVVVVEAAETVEETYFVFELARKFRFIAGVVGWVDLALPGVEPLLRSLKSNPVFKGVRPVHDDNKTVQWMKDKATHRGLNALADLGLSFDALVQNVIELPHITDVARRFPTLSVILDHCGKPDIANNKFAGWASDIARLAELPNVTCKFSGLLNQAGPGWTIEMIRPYAEHVVKCFGAQRLMWGGDWPPARLTAEYDVGWRAAHELLAHLPAHDQEMIFGGNAARIYRL